MKNIISTTVICVLLLVNCKEDNKDMETETIEDTEMAAMDDTDMQNEWTVLFDGTSTDAWRGYNDDGMYDNWTIDGDALKFTPGDEGGKNIITKDTFTNFVLSLDWKVAEGANSGIFWSVYEDPKFSEAYQTGPEIQVLDNERHPDAKVANGTHTAGSLYDMIAMDPELVNPAGEWNHIELTINHDENIGKVSMNGTEAFTFPVHGPEWDDMVENSKFKGWEGFGKYRTGHIGLQDHGDVVWFRYIKIKRL
ncbi:MAG: DUF1080 domain-containing protein [Flavobacteriaceae bacterium]|nr:DUF1080 domain-containing protein [Flavobacteriaceae bacterium]